MFRHTGEVLHAFDVVSILPTDSLVTSTTKADLVCSYNWVNDSTPSVLVPGMFKPKRAPTWLTQRRRRTGLDKARFANSHSARFRCTFYRSEQLEDAPIPV